MKIRPCTFKEAVQFVNEYHRHHNASIGCKFCIKAVDNDNNVIGVAICGRPVSRYLDNGLTLEINRLCTDGTMNCCSFLYSACCRIAKNMGYEKVITYILESELGTSLSASQFICEGIAGGIHWTGKRNTGVEIPNEMKKRYVRIL